MAGSKVSRKLRTLILVEKLRLEGKLCGGWARYPITKAFPEDRLVELLSDEKCNRLTPILRHFDELHASACQPKLLEQFNERFSNFNQTVYDLLMSHIDKIVRKQLGVEDRDFTMEDFIRSKTKLDAGYLA